MRQFNCCFLICCVLVSAQSVLFAISPASFSVADVPQKFLEEVSDTGEGLDDTNIFCDHVDLITDVDVELTTHLLEFTGQRYLALAVVCGPHKLRI